MSVAAAEGGVRGLPSLAGRLPSPPPRSLDPFLDAAAACFARHGIRRTSVQDIAQEMGRDRTTVYRRVGTVDAISRLLLARELNRLLAELPRGPGEQPAPESIVGILAGAVDFWRGHPVLVKVRADEPELIGSFLGDLPEIVDRVAAAVAPLLQSAMDDGRLAPQNPVVLAEWLVRIGLSLIVAPPPGNVEDFLAQVLLPALAPDPRENP